ncbi:MAG: hypothetical protein EKK42_10235 [Pseudonocardiaceae bacterium]|nr:MAG: hypothetical protein EKK42_10235 [Pseudonocardiaceae bacterium]
MGRAQGVGIATAGPAAAGPGLEPVVMGSATSLSQLALTASIPAQTVQATVQPNASQNILIPAPTGNDFTKLPFVTSNSPNLVVASASYSGDQKDLMVSVMNVDPDDPTSGTLTVDGWGTYPVTVAPNPSQVVLVPLPAPDYDTSKLPYVSSQTPNLQVFSTSYYYVNGVQELAVNLGNPFPFDAVTGPIVVDW